MSDPVRKRGFLLHLAAEGMTAVLADCVRALTSQRGIELFGSRIVERWSEWMHGQSPGVRLSAVAELADWPLVKARAEVVATIEQLSPQRSPEERAIAVEYLAAIPRSAQRVLVLDQATGGRTLPAGTTVDNPLSLLNLLPLDVPPYAPGLPLPNTPYTLTDLAGGSDLGVFYRAKKADIDTPFLIKVCVDPSMVTLLRQLPARQISGRWSERLVRPVDQNLDHPTPFLVFEHGPGGDLTMLLANLRHQTGRGLAPDEVYHLIEQVAEGLAFAHALGVTHGDLKPANVLVSGDTLRVADVGVGVAGAERAIQRGELDTGSVDEINRMRGAATWLYLSPERKRGGASEPRHDLYSLGVLWYQLLVGDVTRAIPEDWASKIDLAANQMSVLARCLGPLDERPRDGQAMLALLRPETKLVAEVRRDTVVSPEEMRRERRRQEALLIGLKGLLNALRDQHEREQSARLITISNLLWLLFLGLLVEGYEALSSQRYWMGIFPPLIVGAWIAGRTIKQRHGELKSWDALRRRVQDLMEEHREEILAWGGMQVLLNVDLLPEIIASFEEDLRTLSPELQEESG